MKNLFSGKTKKKHLKIFVWGVQWYPWFWDRTIIVYFILMAQVSNLHAIANFWTVKKVLLTFPFFPMCFVEILISLKCGIDSPAKLWQKQPKSYFLAHFTTCISKTWHDGQILKANLGLCYSFVVKNIKNRIYLYKY